MKMTALLGFIPRLVSRLRRFVELTRYNNYTISEYFRKQGAQVGEDCYIVIRQLGTEPYLVSIGNHVAIAEGTLFHTHDGGTWVFRQEMPDLRVFGPIIIKDNCMIGAHVHLLPGVTVGPNSIVAAGSVVITDVPPNSVVMGVPARAFGSLEKYREKCFAKWDEQKPPTIPPDYFEQLDVSPHRETVRLALRNHLAKLFEPQLKRP